VSEAGLRILIVDDEQAIRRLLRTLLTAHGYTIIEAASGEAALVSAAQHQPDIVILDLGLPGIDGVEVTRRLRQWTDIPVIVLSVREQERDKIAALDAGADDYVTKPFAAGELMARLRAARRRVAQPKSAPVFMVGNLTVDTTRRLVTMAGAEVQLTPTEYDLLCFLTKNAGKVVTHQQLLRQVWGVAYQQEFHLLRVNVSNLRHKLEPDPARPQYIVTEPGVGYRLREEP